jgi:Holliday junction resolvasome RuvABC endonuclease subunit
MIREYLGIDPGLSGGLAVVSSDKIKYKIAMPTITIIKANGDSKRVPDQHGISSFLSSIPKHTHCVIEEQHPARNQSIVAICTTCRNYGVLLGALYAAHLFTTEVTAKIWQEHYGIISVKKSGGKSTKEQGFDIAQTLYPGVAFRKSERSYKFHDGLTDAALIANYCQFLFKGENNEKDEFIERHCEEVDGNITLLSEKEILEQ